MQRTLTLKTCKRTEEYYDRGIVDVSEARHLFRVAAGLESPLLGETAILGQIKKSYDEARREDKLSANINRLFQQAIHVGHRVRVETGISRGAVSYSQVTVDILCKELADLGNKVVSIIGVNELTESVLNFLSARGATNIILSNRSIEKAEELAEKFNAEVMPLSDKRHLLDVCDVVISATSAPHTIIDFEDLPMNRKKDLYLFDLANPRDIEPSVVLQPFVKLYNLEQIESLAQQNIKAREKEVAKCEAIIEEEIAELIRWSENRLIYTERRAG